jgi:hypothetical protein
VFVNAAAAAAETMLHKATSKQIMVDMKNNQVPLTLLEATCFWQQRNNEW